MKPLNIHASPFCDFSLPPSIGVTTPEALAGAFESVRVRVWRGPLHAQVKVPPAKRRSRAQPVTIPRFKRARRLAEAAGIDPKTVTFNPDGSYTFGGATAPVVEDSLDHELAEFEARHGTG